MLADKDCHTECFAPVPCRIHCARCYNAAYTIVHCIYGKVYGNKECMAGLPPMHPCNIIWDVSGPYLQEAMQGVTGHKTLTYPMHLLHPCMYCVTASDATVAVPCHDTCCKAAVRTLHHPACGETVLPVPPRRSSGDGPAHCPERRARSSLP